MWKILISGIVVLGIAGGMGYFVMKADVMDFESVCDKRSKRYTKKFCKNVDKQAYSKKSVVNLNEKNYGYIRGVAWRKKGSIISSRNQKTKRYSEGNAFYYIVGPKKGTSSKRNQQFLRLTSETDAR